MQTSTCPRSFSHTCSTHTSTLGQPCFLILRGSDCLFPSWKYLVSIYSRQNFLLAFATDKTFSIAVGSSYTFCCLLVSHNQRFCFSSLCYLVSLCGGSASYTIQLGCLRTVWVCALYTHTHTYMYICTGVWTIRRPFSLTWLEDWWKMH